MLSMESTQKRGYTFWDQSLLPVDEYFERVRSVREAMARNGLDAVIVFANNLNPGNVSYLAGNQAGTLLITKDGDPAMYTGGGGRELPFQRMLTWIPDVATGQPNIQQKIAGEIANRGLTKGTIRRATVSAETPFSASPTTRMSAAERRSRRNPSRTMT